MKAQPKYILRSDSHKLPRAPRPRNTQAHEATPPVRQEIVDQARRRIAAGFYDSDLCLHITVRRITRALDHPAAPPQSVSSLPGRLAGKLAPKRPGKSGPRRRD